MLTWKDVLNAKTALKYTGKNPSALKVTLKKNHKGVSLYSTKPIKKGHIIANYKFNVYNYSHRGVKNNMYTINVYTKSGKYNPNLIGDIYGGSLEEPKYNIPYWAYFSNEPSGDDIENCALDINIRGNYRNKKVMKVGDTMIYKLRATRNIPANTEIVWCYGEDYMRKYIANCD